jgi:hypothetical protein
MFLRLVVLSLLVVFPSNSYAQPRLYDFVVGGTIKNLAKIYVKTSNLPKLKDKYITKIMNMRDDKFRKYFMKFFVVYKQLPSDLQQTYVFTESTTKSDAIDLIHRVNKRDLIMIINKIPSEFIVKQTKNYSQPPKDQIPNSAQVNETFLWRRIIQKI